MILLGFLFVYAVVAFGMWRATMGHLAWRMMKTKKMEYPALYKNLIEPTGEVWFMALMVAFPIALVWPVSLVFVRWPFAIGEEREAKKRELQQRIRELEREAGL